MVKIEKLTKKYGDYRALDGVSCEFRDGEVACVLGENGAGKSTLLKAICTILPTDSGKIFFDGVDIAQNPIEAKRKIGYVAENPAFVENFSVAEYLRMAASLLNDCPQNFLDATVEKFSLNDVLDKKISALSKGYRQRLAFAQCFLKKPTVFVFDEPTTALDPAQIAEVRSRIVEAKRGATVVLSTHLMQEVSAVCDRIFILHHGKMLLSGTHDEILTKTGEKDIESAFLKLISAT